jgi:hypothetical protein
MADTAKTEKVSPIREDLEVISLFLMPENRFNFKFIGQHEMNRPTWNGDFSAFSLGAATVATKLSDIVSSYKGFPVANVNVLPQIESNIDKVPSHWIDKVIYIIGTTFADPGKEEHVMSFQILENEEGRSLLKRPRSFIKGIEPNSRVLIFND